MCAKQQQQQHLNAYTHPSAALCCIHCHFSSSTAISLPGGVDQARTHTEMAAVQQQQTATAVKIISGGAASSGNRPLQVTTSAKDGSSSTSSAVEMRSSAVILQTGSSSSGGSQNAPTQQTPVQQQIITTSTAVQPKPSSRPMSPVFIIRPAPMSPTAAAAPSGGFFVQTAGGPIPSAVNGPSSAAMAPSSVVIQPRPVVNMVPVPAATAAPSATGRTSFSIVSTTTAMQVGLTTGNAPTTVTSQQQQQQPQEISSAPAVKTAGVVAPEPQPAASAFIRPPPSTKKTPAGIATEKKGPPPLTPSDLLAQADPMWVCGFALLVMAVAFATMASEGEIPISYVLTGVVAASLAAFVKLKL